MLGGLNTTVTPKHRKVCEHIYVTLPATMPRHMRSYYLDDDLIEGLQAMRDRDGILPSEQVRRAIALWLKVKGYKPKRKKGGKKK